MTRCAECGKTTCDVSSCPGWITEPGKSMITTQSPRAEDYLITHPGGVCGAVVGLPEEVTAMLFAFYSRSSKTLRESLQQMLDDGSLTPPPVISRDSSQRVRLFHEKTTIGYGHKSVADHATLHPFFEGVSMVAERDMMTARLMAATSKSTRYVDFKHAQVYTPPEVWKNTDEFQHHASCLFAEYEVLTPLAVDAVRKAFPYTQDWKASRWENATEKRAFDIVRDLLPTCTKTSFGMTMSATSAREILDKRSTSSHLEIRWLSGIAREVLREATPSLIPAEARKIPSSMFNPTPPDESGLICNSKIEVLQIPDWPIIEHMLGVSAEEAVKTWSESRARHMPPDRSSEFADYTFKITMPFSVARDLGRHRMVTQMWSWPSSKSPFGCDPVLADAELMSRVPTVGLLAAAYFQALERAQSRMTGLRSRIPPSIDPYICPMATMVTGLWKINLRELIHVCGLRTTPQGHPAYRRIVQALVRAINLYDPTGGAILNTVTNFDDVLVGRPN